MKLISTLNFFLAEEMSTIDPISDLGCVLPEANLGIHRSFEWESSTPVIAILREQQRIILQIL